MKIKVLLALALVVVAAVFAFYIMSPSLAPMASIETAAPRTEAIVLPAPLPSPVIVLRPTSTPAPRASNRRVRETTEDRLAKALRPAQLAFNTPKDLWLDETKTVELVIAPKGENTDAAAALSSGLSGEVVVENTVYSMVMEAKLSGDGFMIDDRVQRKTILPNNPAKWVWKVTPKEAGERKRLTLEVHAILIDGNRELPPLPVQTFHRDVLVNVSVWQDIVAKVGAMETVNSAIVGIGGIFGALAALFSWLRRRKSRSPV